jgi:hypothetical protein
MRIDLTPPATPCSAPAGALRPRLVGLAEAARYFGKSKNTFKKDVASLLKPIPFPGQRGRRKILYDVRELDRLIDALGNLRR